MKKVNKITGLIAAIGLFLIVVVSVQSRSIANPGSNETSIASSELAVLSSSSEEIVSGVQLNLTVFLQGPFNGTDMNTTLGDSMLIPLDSPYPGLGFIHVGSDSALSTTQAIINNNNIVDWVFVELRDGSDSTSVIATLSALLKNDGTVVNYNGQPLIFTGLTSPGNPYFVAVRHRNHLGVMTANTFILISSGTAVDMTSDSLFGTNPAATLTGVGQGMYMGDANGNGFVNFQGSSNDVDEIFFNVGFDITNTVLDTYNNSDLNFNGFVNYQGSFNDVDQVFFSLSFDITETLFEQLP